MMKYSRTQSTTKFIEMTIVVLLKLLWILRQQNQRFQGSWVIDQADKNWKAET